MKEDFADKNKIECRLKAGTICNQVQRQCAPI